VKDQLAARTEGNPLFLEESVRALVEAGALAGQRGEYRLDRPLADAPPPASVQSLLAARIDRLDAADKRLLQAAAVVGKASPFPLLRALAEVDEEPLRAGLARLIDAELLYEAALFPELEYAFKNTLTHRIAYGSLPGEQRRALHARVVEVLERARAERLDEHVDRLAEHAYRAELWDKAARYHRRAGRRDAARAAHRDAVANLERALAALEHLGDDSIAAAGAVDLRLDLCASLSALGAGDAVATHLQAAERAARELADGERLARVRAAMAARPTA
jgi:predicted ATPase